MLTHPVADDTTPTHRVPFTLPFHARWPDMDFNAHLRNAAYLGEAEDSRMRYFEQQGFPMRELARLRVGPVVSRDELDYRGELRLLETGTVTLMLAGLSDDGSRFRLRNTFMRDHDGRLAATVTSTGGWLDLTERRLVAPPAELLTVLADLVRTDDFEVLPSSVRKDVRAGG